MKSLYGYSVRKSVLDNWCYLFDQEQKFLAAFSTYAEACQWAGIVEGDVLHNSATAVLTMQTDKGARFLRAYSVKEDGRIIYVGVTSNEERIKRHLLAAGVEDPAKKVA